MTELKGGLDTKRYPLTPAINADMLREFHEALTEIEVMGAATEVPTITKEQKTKLLERLANAADNARDRVSEYTPEQKRELAEHAMRAQNAALGSLFGFGGPRWTTAAAPIEFEVTEAQMHAAKDSIYAELIGLINEGNRRRRERSARLNMENHREMSKLIKLDAGNATFASTIKSCREFGFCEEITRETLWNTAYRLGRSRWHWGPSWMVTLTGWFNTRLDRMAKAWRAQ